MTKRVLNLSTVITGGAGNYALDFHRFLNKLEYDSYLVIKDIVVSNKERIIQYPDKRTKKFFSKLRRALYRFFLNKFTFNERYFFYNKFEKINCYSASTILKLLPDKPDIIFIHWVSGFVNAKLIYDLAKQTGAKIYIFMIDNAPITGGCHYPWDCKGFEVGCKPCPAINSIFIRSLARKNLEYKIKYNVKNISIISCSQSDYKRVENSMLFHKRIHYSFLGYVNETKFTPAKSKNDLKDYFGIDQNMKVIFFGATFLNEERKGICQLLRALDLIKNKDIVLLIAGNANIGELNLKNKRVGFLSEEDLIKAYQVADIFVCPSLEDSGPMMINQSIMCGTPVVSFEMGVAYDLVQTGKTGYRAKLFDSVDLANGIDYLLDLSESDMLAVNAQCRNFAIEHFGFEATKCRIQNIIV